MTTQVVELQDYYGKLEKYALQYHLLFVIHFLNIYISFLYCSKKSVLHFEAPLF